MYVAQRFVPGLLAGALVLGSGSGVLAAKNTAKAKFAVTAGQVSNLSTQGFTLTLPQKKGATAPAKTFQVSVDAKTKETARKGTTGTLANGFYVVVVGKKTGTAILARHILFSATAFKVGKVVRRVKATHMLKVLARHTAAGTVNLSATTSTSLVITTKKGKTLTFVLNAQTKFRASGQLLTAAPTFTNGQRVRVLFRNDKATKSHVALVVALAKTA
jgi:hypothetical protein